MIELRNDSLVFSFPEVHADARLEVELQRTLRIPDDRKSYPLPPGLGRFPLRHVDDFAARLPEEWVRHGGVVLPMYQAEALWIRFSPPGGYPFAVKVATGKINAVTGESWRDGLNRGPQDYVAVPGQPWLDGYVVEKGFIRQFVAMPLGAGYTAEEQVTGAAEHGGLQVMAFPLKREAWERILAERARARMELPVPPSPRFAAAPAAAGMAMGLGAGGRMKQEIYTDHMAMEDWDLRASSRCFVHIANSLVWRSVTGSEPPTVPPDGRGVHARRAPLVRLLRRGAQGGGGIRDPGGDQERLLVREGEGRRAAPREHARGGGQRDRPAREAEPRGGARGSVLTFGR
jgi:hypothetical protein